MLNHQNWKIKYIKLVHLFYNAKRLNTLINLSRLSIKLII